MMLRITLLLNQILVYQVMREIRIRSNSHEFPHLNQLLKAILNSDHRFLNASLAFLVRSFAFCYRALEVIRYADGSLINMYEGKRSHYLLFLPPIKIFESRL